MRDDAVGIHDLLFLKPALSDPIADADRTPPHDRENSIPALIYKCCDALPRLVVDLSAFHECGEQLAVNGTGQLDRGDTNPRYLRSCGWMLSLSFAR